MPSTERWAIALALLLLSSGARAQLHPCSYCEQMAAKMRQMAASASSSQRQLGGASTGIAGTYGSQASTAEQAAQRYDAEARACRAGQIGPSHVCGPTGGAASSVGGASGSGLGGARGVGGAGGAGAGGASGSASSEPTSAPFIGDITNAVQGVDQTHYAGGASAGSIGLSSQNLDQSAAPPDQCPAGQVVLEIDFPGGVKCGPWPPATPPELDFGQAPAPPPSEPAAIGQTIAQPDPDPPAPPPAPSLLGYPLGSPFGLGASPSTASASGSTSYSIPAGGNSNASPPAGDSDSSGSGGGGLGDSIRQGGRMLPKPANADLRRKQRVMVGVSAAAQDCLGEGLAGTDDRTCGEKIAAHALVGLLPDGAQRDLGKLERFVNAVRKAPAWLNAKLDQVCDSGSAQCTVTRRYLHRLFGQGDDP